MKFSFSEIITVLSNYGWFIGIFAIVLFVLVKYVLYNYERWFSSVNPHDDITVEDEGIHSTLKLHPFFSNADYRLKIEIPNMDIIPNKPVREQVYKDLVGIAFKDVYDACNDIISHEDMNDWSHEKWMDEVTKRINQIAINIENDASRIGIPDIVTKKFSKWNADTIESLKEYVLMLGHSKLYTTNVTKTNTFLFIMNLLLVTILGDAERTLREINGELKGVKYRGMPIE